MKKKSVSKYKLIDDWIKHIWQFNFIYYVHVYWELKVLIIFYIIGSFRISSLQFEKTELW